MPGAQNIETDGTKTKGAGAAGGEGEIPPKTPPDGEVDDGGGEGDFSDPAKAMAEIKKLRAENAKHRTKNKSLEDEFGKVKSTMGKMKQAMGLEDDEADPEQQLATLKQQNETLQVQVALSELCSENEIPASAHKYFKFLIGQEFEALGDGEEISDERVKEIAAEAKKFAPGGAAPASGTGVKPGSGAPPPAGSSDAISVAQFAKMNTGEKSELYTKNPALYQKLFDEAQEKRLL